MSGVQPPEVFKARHRLGHRELDRVALRTASVDHHHVAKVHGAYGIIDGFTITIDGELTVHPGQAYSSCGRLVSITEAVTLGPPAMVGDYRVWLGLDASVSVKPIAERTPGALLLAEVKAGLAFIGHRSMVAWVDEVDVTHRPNVANPVLPQLGAGRERLGLADVTLDGERKTITRRVSTVDAQFERTPLYFATIAVDRVLRPEDLDRLTGWFTTICSPSATGFTVRVNVSATDDLFDELALWQSVSSDGFSPVDFDVIWIGVDPRRPGVAPADLGCDDQPPLPSPEPS